MDQVAILLVTEYDGGEFAGWQRQPAVRTVQGDMETVLERLCRTRIPARAAGRTDAGVHARGQAVGVRVPARWTPAELRRAMNALLPRDVRVAGAYRMTDRFHPRHDARTRRYRYFVGLDDNARSPFRRRTTWALGKPLDVARLDAEAAALHGAHGFRAFAVAHTAPVHDDHRCEVYRARWRREGQDAVFEIEANRFLHHMVRFLVGTMVDVATGRRAPGAVAALLDAADNAATAAPAPPEGLFLEQVTYPAACYHPDVAGNVPVADAPAAGEIACG